MMEREAILISTQTGLIWRARLAAGWKSNSTDQGFVRSYKWLVILYQLWAWSMQLCKMLLQESSGTKHQSSAIGNQLDTRERTMKKMWQLFSLLIFTYWCRGVSLHKILETKNCDKSHGVTLPSLNVRLSNTITNHCLQFSSQKKSSVQTNCNFRPIIRPNSQPRGAHAEFVWRLRVWLLRATVKHPPKTLSSVDDHFQALAGLQIVRKTASVDDLLVLLRPRPEHLYQLVDGSGGDEGADDPPPLLWTLCSFTVL